MNHIPLPVTESWHLDPAELDAVREISNIGVGHAANALSQMIGATVELTVPSVHLLKLSRVHDFVGGPEQASAGILLTMDGDAQGQIMMVFPLETALTLADRLSGTLSRDSGQLTVIGESALHELGNILASSYLNGLSALLGLTILPSVPRLIIDMAGAVLDPILSSQCSVCDTSLLVETEFRTEQGDICGRFYILPDPVSLDVILTAAGLRHG